MDPSHSSAVPISDLRPPASGLVLPPPHQAPGWLACEFQQLGLPIACGQKCPPGGLVFRLDPSDNHRSPLFRAKSCCTRPNQPRGQPLAAKGFCQIDGHHWFALVRFKPDLPGRCAVRRLRHILGTLLAGQRPGEPFPMILPRDGVMRLEGKPQHCRVVHPLPNELFVLRHHWTYLQCNGFHWFSPILRSRPLPLPGSRPPAWGRRPLCARWPHPSVRCRYTCTPRFPRA